MDKKVKAPKKGKSGFQKFKNRLSLLIIIVFAGFVFYMGWIQIRIPEGKYALVYTKTGGYDKTLIEPGQFVWRWENLFPQNLSLHYIDLISHPGTMDMEGFLPSGELYGGFIHEPEAFKFQIKTDYRFSMKEDQFVSFIESGQYDARTIENHNSQYISDVNRLVKQYFLDHSPVPQESLNDTETDLMQKISDAYPGYKMERFHITSYTFPDPDLYETTKNLYLNEIRNLREVELKQEQSSSLVEAYTSRKMDLLRKYGEILSEYPVLLQYFGLDRDKLDPSLFTELSRTVESP